MEDADRVKRNLAIALGLAAAACAHMINLSIKEKRMVEWDFEKDDVKR